MNPKVVSLPSFTMIGVAARTSNAKEMTGEGVIGKLWGRLATEGFVSKIPNKVDSTIVAAYTDYASDKDGEYTFILGAKVSSNAEVPAGMIATTIPGGRYAVFTSEKGPASKVVVEAWKQIWSVPQTQPGGDRAYKADYELYDERARDPQNTQVDIYVGIK
jgi:predicted transcriptional regulator YdeE